MDTSIFLAQFLGLYLTMVSIAALTQRKKMVSVVDDFFKNQALVLFSGGMIAAVGIIIVLNHNIWEFNWRGIITILGYGTIIKGLFQIFATEKAEAFSQTIMRKVVYFPFLMIILSIGIYLIVKGF